MCPCGHTYIHTYYIHTDSTDRSMCGSIVWHSRSIDIPIIRPDVFLLLPEGARTAIRSRIIGCIRRTRTILATDDEMTELWRDVAADDTRGQPLKLINSHISLPEPAQTKLSGRCDWYLCAHVLNVCTSQRHLLRYARIFLRLLVQSILVVTVTSRMFGCLSYIPAYMHQSSFS